MATRAPRGFGQYNGVARAVERVGERWALLIVRDLLSGARRYGDLKTNLPRIPTNILSDRLKELQAWGVILRVPTIRGGGYELTALGRELEPIVLALERWGWSVLGDPAQDEVITRDALAASLRAAFRPDTAAGAPTRFVLHVADASLALVVAESRFDIEPIGPGALPQPRGSDADSAPAPVAEITLTPTQFRDVVSGALQPGGAAARHLTRRHAACSIRRLHAPGVHEVRSPF